MTPSHRLHRNSSRKPSLNCVPRSSSRWRNKHLSDHRNHSCRNKIGRRLNPNRPRKTMIAISVRPRKARMTRER